MKSALTPEQSQRLIELGVDPSRASIRPTTNHIGQPYILIEHGIWSAQTLCVNPKPIFTLSDILSLLPKEIYSDERDITYSLTIEMRPFGSSVRYANTLYRKSYGPTKSAPELIDALFELLVWVLQNHPDKIRKK